VLKKLLLVLTIISSALIILGVSIHEVLYKYSNKQEDTILHQERVGVVVPNEFDEKPIYKSAKASWYGRSACGKRIYGETCKTASGEIFNEEEFTMACSYDFALGDRIELCYNDRCAVAVCTDRGNFVRLGRTFDLSRGLFQYFDNLSVGVISVNWRKL